MGKRKFKIGDEVVSIRESDKEGVVIGYHRDSGEYEIRLRDGNTHCESARLLEKKQTNN